MSSPLDNNQPPPPPPFSLHQLLKSDQFVLWGWKIIQPASDPGLDLSTGGADIKTVLMISIITLCGASDEDE